jgi:hypothetical protein
VVMDGLLESGIKYLLCESTIPIGTSVTRFREILRCNDDHGVESNFASSNMIRFDET